MGIFSILTFVIFVGTVICQASDKAARYVEGDIIGISPYFFQTKSGLINPSFRWPNATIPYQFDEGYPLESQLLFRKATDYISSLTCVRFMPRTTEYDYVKVISGEGCYAHAGRMVGEQLVSLPEECTRFGIGVIVHEIIHVIGYLYEQSRSDRDKFVLINWENIIPEAKHNFMKFNKNVVDSFGVEYDFDSIMHYPSDAWSSNGLETITTIPPGIPIGQLEGMSPKDVLKVNRMYMCGGSGD